MIRAEEAFKFPILDKKSVSISDQPFESDSSAMKIRVKVAYSCLTFLKKPPPPLFQILATRLNIFVGNKSMNYKKSLVLTLQQDVLIIGKLDQAGLSRSVVTSHVQLIY